MECHQPIHCMPGFGNLGCVAPFVSHTHFSFGELCLTRLLSPSAWPQLLLPKLEWAAGPWCVGWWPWDPLGLQLSSDHAFPGFQVHASLSSLGKSKCSLGSCSCSVLCSLQSVISVFLCLVWCPALPGCCFASSGRSEEGSRARCSAGIDQPWCVYISEMLTFWHNHNILKMFPLGSTHAAELCLVTQCLACIHYSFSTSHTLLLLLGCPCLYSSGMFFNKTCLSQTFV